MTITEKNITTTRARARTSQSGPRPARHADCEMGKRRGAEFFSLFFIVWRTLNISGRIFGGGEKSGHFGHGAWPSGPRFPIRRKTKNPTSQGERATKGLVELSLPEQDGGK